MILTPNLRKMDRLRLVMLFALRYEKQARDIEELVRLLGTKGVSEAEARVSLQTHFRGGMTNPQNYVP